MSADPVLEWNRIAVDAVQYDSTQGHNALANDPGHSSRVFAIESAAVYDAVNSITGQGTRYLTKVDAPRDASITAAVAQAAHDTLVSLLPDYKSALDADLAADLASVHDARARDEGVQVGKTTAAAILAARSDDHSNVDMTWPSGTQPGQWQPDPLHSNQKAWGPLWGGVTPFTMTPSAVGQFDAPPPPPITSQAYADAYMEVKNYGGDGVITPTLRTPDETQIAFFWGYDGSPGVGTPPVNYNEITEAIATQQHNNVVDNARLFALVNLAMADSAIVCWDGKYQYDYWRPITGIRENDLGTGLTGAGSGNPYLVGQGDPYWTYLGAPEDNGGGTNFTPPFPSYPSGHATFGGALFTMLADFYGTDNIHFTIGSDEFNGVTRDQNGNVRPIVYRSYNSFSQAAEENGQSRIYLGIHWSFDKTAGIQCGDNIANYVFGNLLQPVHGHNNDGSGHDGHHGNPHASADAASGGTAGQRPGILNQTSSTTFTTAGLTADPNAILVSALMHLLDHKS
jgi:hypothetical protein